MRNIAHAISTRAFLRERGLDADAIDDTKLYRIVTLDDDDRDILAVISVMVLAIANRQNLADQPHMQDDDLEGLEPAPCGSPSKDEPARYCIREPGHPGRHKFRPLDGLVN